MIGIDLYEKSGGVIIEPSHIRKVLGAVSSEAVTSPKTNSV
jgi:hypothetical protein